MKLLSRTKDRLMVQDREAAALLFQARPLELLGALVAEEQSLQQVSDALGWPLNTTKYQLERLLAAKLAHCTREEPRAGRAVRYFQAVARQFFVGYAETPAETPAALCLQSHLPFEERFAEHLSSAALAAGEANGDPDWGVEFRFEHGTLMPHPSLEAVAQWNFLAPDQPALIDVWSEDLRLEPEEAKALQLELCHLFERYGQKSGRGRYLLRLGLTPLREDT